MTDDYIQYEDLIDEAMHVIVQKALDVAAEKGLPGEHHFFISFNTTHPDVQISEALHQRYPEEMTIVLQYQFENLVVTAEGFGVQLSFDGVNEKLYVPFSALTAFADPSVKFGLQFRQVDDMWLGEEDDDDMYIDDITPQQAPGNSRGAKNGKTKPAKNPDGSNVISLDSFRKK